MNGRKVLGDLLEGEGKREKIKRGGGNFIGRKSQESMVRSDGEEPTSN